MFSSINFVKKWTHSLNNQRLIELLVAFDSSGLLKVGSKTSLNYTTKRVEKGIWEKVFQLGRVQILKSPKDPEWEVTEAFDSLKEMIGFLAEASDSNFTEVHCALGSPSDSINDVLNQSSEFDEKFSYDEWSFRFDDFVIDNHAEEILVGDICFSLFGFLSDEVFMTSECMKSIRGMDQVRALENSLNAIEIPPFDRDDLENYAKADFSTIELDRHKIDQVDDWFWVWL